MNNFKFIAEMCCNHMGDVSVAKKMIYMAKKSGAHVAKFQKRDIKTWATRKPKLYDSPHPCPKNAYGKTYREHREKLELSINEHVELKRYCDFLGIEYSCSVWDIPSAKGIITLNPNMIKIASACNQYWELLEYICEHFNGEIHISLGMTTKEDINKIINFFVKHERNKDLIVYACTSGYPLMTKDICLLEICKLKEQFGHMVKGIGFSGHHCGIIPDIVAYALGAGYIERHFTLNKTFKGTDHKLSLNEKELTKLIKDLTEVKTAMSYKIGGILNVETTNKEKLKW